MLFKGGVHAIDRFPAFEKGVHIFFKYGFTFINKNDNIFILFGGSHFSEGGKQILFQL